MSKRYSDTLRERAELWLTGSEFSLGFHSALLAIADELDSPEFSGRIVYEQRNAAQEDANRWEAEAITHKKRLVALLKDALEQPGLSSADESELRAELRELQTNGTDETNAEEA